MMKLNERALENVVGGGKFEIPQCVEEFACGFGSYHLAPYIAMHDIVVSKEKRVEIDNTVPFSEGVLLSAISYSALSIGVYEGEKHIYKKIKNKLSSK